MNQIHEARLELMHLEKQVQDFQAKFFDSRTALQAQKAKVETLIRQSAHPIGRLPVDIFLYIAKLSGLSPLDLMGVSRRWKNVVLQSPSLWTNIRVSPKWSTQLVEAHVGKSSQLLLDITIHSWRTESRHKGNLFAMLDVLIPHAHRWRSFVIENDVDGSFIAKISSRINHITTYPSLTHLSVAQLILQYSSEIQPIQCRKCPRLEHLELRGRLGPILGNPIPPNLTSLTVVSRIEGCFWFFRYSYLAQFQQLTTLSLSGATTGMELEPNSIHFPVLEKFVCQVWDPKVLLQAIVAPTLGHFEYVYLNVLRSEITKPDPFEGYDSKLQNVASVVLRSSGWDAKSIWSTFSAARHVNLTMEHMVRALQQEDVLRTALHWKYLESLTVHNLYCQSSLRRLVAWLEERYNIGRPKLRVKLMSIDQGLVQEFHDALHEHCILEWNISVCIDLFSAGGQQWAVCTFSLSFRTSTLTLLA